jgi:hypothetical protein
LQPCIAELAGAPGVDEPDDGDAAQRREQLYGHGADGGEIALAVVAAAREVVDRDRDLMLLGEGADGNEEK